MTTDNARAIQHARPLANDRQLLYVHLYDCSAAKSVGFCQLITNPLMHFWIGTALATIMVVFKKCNALAMLWDFSLGVAPARIGAMWQWGCRIK
jgi:hypothetical protein